jgi:hypothetical protein
MSHTKAKKQTSHPIIPVAIPADAVFLTARELAGLLRKTSLKSIYRLAKSNQIAHVHDAGGLLFVRESVNQYIASRFIPASPEKAQQKRRAA